MNNFHTYTPCPLKLSSLTSIQYLKVTFFQTSIHAAPGGKNSPHF